MSALRRILLSVVLLLGFVVQAPAEPVNVFAAASLKNALDAVSAAWKAQAGKETKNIYAASSALAKQIEQAAPADVFISADLDWMDYVAEKKLIKPDTRKTLLGNALVLVAAKDSGIKLELKQGADLAGALAGGKLAVGDVKAVPAGKYAKAALEKLGLWAAVEASLAQAENVRAALALVARGEAKLGIVYTTDANAEKHVEIAGVFPEDSHPPIVYPVAVINSSKNPDAEAFVHLSLFAQGTRDLHRAGLHDSQVRLVDGGPFPGGLDRHPPEPARGERGDARLFASGHCPGLRPGALPLSGRTLLDGLIHLPLVMPPVVTGYLLLLSFGRKGPIGGFLDQCCGLVFSFRWTGAALAAAVMGLPLMVRAIRLTLENMDRRLEQAAGTLGARPLFVFATVTLPLAAPGILAGSILSFAKALGEFGATITFVSNIPGETQTIPAAIYTFTQVPGGDANALRLTAVSIAISLVALIASEILARRLNRQVASFS